VAKASLAIADVFTKTKAHPVGLGMHGKLPAMHFNGG
jgi:hypothetical protein